MVREINKFFQLFYIISLICVAKVSHAQIPTITKRDLMVHHDEKIPKSNQFHGLFGFDSTQKF